MDIINVLLVIISALFGGVLILNSKKKEAESKLENSVAREKDAVLKYKKEELSSKKEEQLKELSELEKEQPKADDLASPEEIEDYWNKKK